jgi:hypothetical protein
VLSSVPVSQRDRAPLDPVYPSRGHAGWGFRSRRAVAQIILVVVVLTMVLPMLSVEEALLEQNGNAIPPPEKHAFGGRFLHLGRKGTVRVGEGYPLSTAGAICIC